MANICTNTFCLCANNDKREDFEKSLDNINKVIHDSFDGEITYATENYAEGEFDSKRVFPMDDFEDLLVGDVYFRCLSEEYGEEYVAMNIYNNGWREEQTFDL